MTDLVAVVESLAIGHGPLVSIDVVRDAARMSRPAFRAEVFALAKSGRLLLSVQAKPAIVDADAIERDWFVPGEGEVKFVSVIHDVHPFHLLGAEDRRPWLERCVERGRLRRERAASWTRVRKALHEIAVKLSRDPFAAMFEDSADRR
jgi:hypothetical protein